MTIRLYDSVTREVRDFVPQQEGRAGVYVCGLTVQSEPHVGHVRSGVNFDVLRRWLTHRGLEVTFIRNVTDIDDKILVKSAEQGRPWFNLAYDMTRALTSAYDALNVLPPTYEPLATGHVPEMLALIERLIERGHAYPAADGSGDVYFDVMSWPAYGELSGQRVTEMEAAADADPRGKRDPRDFALWKGRKDSEPETASWPSPWGPGRPGWHIECSAMARKYLGPSFDIHGGGDDLRFPHHENEQAQSRAAGDGFATTWMHNAWITTAGEKMSKSLGNSLTIPAVLQRTRAIDLRFYLVAAHYRSHVEFSFEALDEAAAGFGRVENFLERAATVLGEVPLGTPCADFVTAMDDDLGTPAAVAAVHEVTREGNRLLAGGASDALRGAAGSVRAMLGVLGVNPFDPHWASGGSDDARLREAVDVLVAGLLEQRAEARAAKDFATADTLRDRIKAAGIEVEDGPSGSTWSLA
ncbi:cysteine--tRNA ligase [Nocardioides sp. HDW12B]|uniref:cysteine--tRNA ligase n=1 Tax=Nocardioides sp. HDW12B TaxID=2714939 RepID=UPI001408045E|nr:cysteine--tRNA ligase [Nocardioides sp. HDW12B]QIK65018.1 cysteine--tRNA ligase [Nocardioides sp. HDW12B]